MVGAVFCENSQRQWSLKDKDPPDSSGGLPNRISDWCAYVLGCKGILVPAPSTFYYFSHDTSERIQNFLLLLDQGEHFLQGKSQTAKSGGCPTINQQGPSDISIPPEMQEFKLHIQRDGMYISSESGCGGAYRTQRAPSYLFRNVQAAKAAV
ncbi:hypothetical protein XELAEV_18040878mg [Xenopus laevis]|uniref:Uncharacterized protein n=1 Tax=Xenopus laevis TaxID=8355 RepID=A0A974CAY9_XENLA|nr:hypothetical protein XELAEV_18040878mg [Xenopus laevis]